MDQFGSKAELVALQKKQFDRFSDASQIMNGLLNAQGILTTSDPERIWPEVLKLSPEHQDEFVNRFEFFVQVCVDAADPNRDRLDDSRLIWSALSRLKVKPPINLFTLIAPNDYIEIYDANGIQVFRNFEFCRLTSYSLSEMLLHPWHELYGRDEKILGQIITAVQKLFSDKSIITSDLGVEAHLCHETKSNSGRSFRVQMKYFAPLFGENNTVPYLFAGSKIERVK